MARMATKETYPWRLPRTAVSNVVTILIEPETSKKKACNKYPNMSNHNSHKSTSLSTYCLNARHQILLGWCHICMSLILPSLPLLGLQLYLSFPGYLHQTGKTLMTRDTHVLPDLHPQHVVVASHLHLLRSHILREKYHSLSNQEVISTTIFVVRSSTRYSWFNCWTSTFGTNSLKIWWQSPPMTWIQPHLVWGLWQPRTTNP